MTLIHATAGQVYQCSLSTMHERSECKWIDLDGPFELRGYRLYPSRIRTKVFNIRYNLPLIY